MPQCILSELHTWLLPYEIELKPAFADGTVNLYSQIMLSGGVLGPMQGFRNESVFVNASPEDQDHQTSNIHIRLCPLGMVNKGHKTLFILLNLKTEFICRLLNFCSSS